jgi:hypothetical protein
MAPLHWRGPGPRLTTSFEYNLRREVPTNLPVQSGGDNLVSRDPGSTAATMSSQSVAGSANAIETMLNAILHHLGTIDVKMEPLQPLQDQVATLETTVQEQAARQQELDATTTRPAEA